MLLYKLNIDPVTICHPTILQVELQIQRFWAPKLLVESLTHATFHGTVRGTLRSCKGL